MELAGLLQEMLQDLRVQEERLQGAAQEWTRRTVALESAVGQACAPRELERFSRFLADLERVLGLLLLLSSRLARVHHALARVGPDGDPDERVKGVQAGGELGGEGLSSLGETILGSAVPPCAHSILSLWL